jgi:Tol biopolymer transport system component
VKPIRGGLLSVVVAALLLFALCPAIASAAYPGANGLIAYQGAEGSDPDSEIFTISPYGGDATQLTDNLVQDTQPSWSANGRRIIFVRWGGPDGAGVWIMRADGHGKHLVAPISAATPYFSPGGGRIVMSTDGISTVRIDGSGLRQLVRGAVYGPKYSPNGKRIVFWGQPDGRQVSGIWTVRRDGSRLRRVTRYTVPEDGFNLNPDWRPDGRRIVYAQCGAASERGCGEGGIYSIRPDGSHRRRVHYWTPCDGGCTPPVYSPSGRRLALHHIRPGDDWPPGPPPCSDIFTISARIAKTRYDYTHRHRQPVTRNCEDLDNGGQGGHASNPSWQPIPPP